MAVVTQRNSKLKPRILSLPIYVPAILIPATGKKLGAGDTRAIRPLRRSFATVLTSLDQDFVLYDQHFEFIEKLRETIDNLFCLCQPIGICIDTTAAKAHVVTHHARTG